MTKNIGASYRDKIKTHAKKNGIPAPLAFSNHVITGFLRRLAASEHADKFCLKGGLMMAVVAGDNSRPTSDVDLNGFESYTVEEMKVIMKEIMETPLLTADGKPDDDGVIFNVDSASYGNVDAGTEFPGNQIVTTASIGGTRVKFDAHVSFGYKINPRVSDVVFPNTLENDKGAGIKMYPVETSIAEKMRAMIYFDSINSRVKDFYDIVRFSEVCNLNADELKKAVLETCEYFGTEVVGPESIAPLKEGGAEDFRSKWNGFLKKNRLQAEDFDTVAERTKEFMGPVLDYILDKGPNPGDWVPDQGWSNDAVGYQRKALMTA